MKGNSRSWTALVALALAVLVGPSLFASGAPEPAAGQAMTVTPVDWYINLTWYKYGGDWGKDKFSRLVEDRFGLKLNFVTPAQEGGQQINTMIASGTVTDLVTVESWLNYRSQMAKAGLLLAYDDLIAKYDPTFQADIKKDIFDWYREADGKNYGLPNFAYSKYDLKPGERLRANAGFTLRHDMYTQLGSPPFKTAQEFLSVLQRVKDEIKTYKGTSVIPLQLYEFGDQGNGSVNWVAEYFAVPFEDAKGNWLYALNQEKYWDGLRFLNDAYRRGLISPENLTDTRDQINQKVAAGRVFALLTAPQDFANQFGSLWDSDNNASYDGFLVRNYQGEDPVLSDISGFGWLTTSVGKSTKAPDKITKLMHFLNSDEGQGITFFGWEGQTYTRNKDGKIVWDPAYEADGVAGTQGAKWGTGFMLQQNWLWAMNQFIPSDKPRDVALSEDRWKAVTLPYSWDGRLRSIKSDPEDPRRDEMQTLGNKIALYWGKQLPKIITAPSQAEARQIWEQSMTEIKGMGLDKLVAYNNDGFQATKKAMSVKFSWPYYK